MSPTTKGATMRLKGNIVMKRVIAITIFTLASLITASSANGQDHRVRATIPFDFTVGNKHLSAGTYTITSQDFVSVVIRNDKEHATVLSNTRIDDAHTDFGRLIFNKYGDQYVLHKILCSYANLNLELPISKAKPHEDSIQGTAQAFVDANQ